ncbi:MAG: hypothetical protein ISS10_02970 [Candidatus Marinimicrobia bacterium]|nr:hypothetical protein [Candidatus Neomarinimicrobiota bacterium]MBL7059943.1 hypothetical protein [Candidatus Neomarinimicrobiota bacterium]
MKHIIILLSIVLIGESCITPTEPVGVKSTLISTIETGGYCRDIAIKDSLLVLAADENGYLAYTFHFDTNHAFMIDTTLFENIGAGAGVGFQAGMIEFPERYNYFIFADLYDALYYVNLTDIDSLGRVPYPGSENRDFIRGFCIDERRENELLIYTLNRSEDGNSSFVSTRLITYFDLFIGNDGKIELWDAEFESTEQLNMSANDLSVGNGLLAVANSQLGVVVFKQQEDGMIADTAFSSYAIDGEGEVISVAIHQENIFAGLSHNEGCEVTQLDSSGHMSSSYRIAEGYSVKSIYHYDGLLALGCGSDGILLYEWFADTNEFVEYGRLDAAYTYTAVIFDNMTVFAATRDGLQIFEIER